MYLQNKHGQLVDCNVTQHSLWFVMTSPVVSV